MILYECDLCKKQSDSRGNMYELNIVHCANNKVNLIRDGKFHICAKCCTTLIKQLTKEEKEGEEKWMLNITF